MKKEISKIVAILIIIALNYAGLSAVGKTMASFSDTETSAGNIFIAGTLDISLDNADTYSSGLMYPGDATTTAISLSNIGSLNSQYTASTTISGSDTMACDYVTMTATTPTFSYTGLIQDFLSPATTTLATTWNFNFTVASDAPTSIWGKTCSFKWTYTAWQDNLPNSSSGFTAIKEKLGAIRIGKAVVLNEILADPNISASAPSNKEFIELYNNSNNSIDVAGWNVSEISGSTEQKYTITTEIGVSKSAVPYGGSTIISAKSWIVLLLSDGTALNNGADTVRLYGPGGIVEIDTFEYTSPKPKGYSFARMPDGVGAWVDPIPTPGEPNEMDNSDSPVLQSINVGLVDDSFGSAIVADIADIVIADTETESQAEIVVETPASDITEEIPTVVPSDEEIAENTSQTQVDESDVLNGETIKSEEPPVLEIQEEIIPAE
jgi:hypothetical protein